MEIKVLIKKFRIVLFIIFSFFLILGCVIKDPSLVKAKSHSLSIPSDNDRDKSEIIVKFKNESQKEIIKSAIKNKLGLSKLHLKKSLSIGIEALEIDAKDNINDIISEFKKDSNVEYVQPNIKLTLSMIPNDPMFSQQWGLYNSGQITAIGTDINAVKAWEISNGNSDVLVGVLDTGLDINHEDLRANVLQNPREISGNGLDDDGNGYVDDIFGWDFANNDAQIFDVNVNEIHGTHVAGIIAASSNNLGISGVAPKVRILPLKFINGTSGYTSDAIDAIAYAKKMGVKIINCSWGSSEYNPALEDIIKNSEMLFICAAGNNGTSSPIYPASFNLPNVLSVAATDNQGQLAAFSNYGSNVKVAAPGVDILSTLPQNTYGKLSGTSMSAPFVSGVAALVLSKKPGNSAGQVAAVIEQNVNVLPSLNGKIKTGGIVNAYKALGGIEESPSPKGDTAELKPEPVKIIPPEPEQKAPPAEPVSDEAILVPPFGIDTTTSSKTPALEIQEITEALVQENLLDIFFLTNGNTTAEIDLMQYDDKGKQKGISSEVKPKNQENQTVPTVNHHHLFVVDDKAQTLSYTIKVWDSEGNSSETSLKSIDVNTLIKGFPEGTPAGDTLHLIVDGSPDQSSPADNVGSSSSTGSVGLLTLGQYDVMSSALDITSSTVVGYGNTLAYYSNVNGNSAGFRDEDWYKINVLEPSTMSINLTPNSNAAFNLYLVDAAGNYLSSATSGGKGSPKSISYYVSNPGYYYIKMSPNVYTIVALDLEGQPYRYFTSDSGPYTLTVYNDITDSVNMGSGTRSLGNIDAETDKDWYTFGLNQKSKVNLKLLSIPSGCDYDMTVYQYQGNYAALTSVGGSYYRENTSENLNLILEPGTYYVKVYSYSGYSTTTQYGLDLNTFTPDVYELNESPAQSQTIGFSQQINATIDNPSDQDWFKFYVSHLSKINMKLSNIPSGCDYDLSIFGSSLNYVGGSYCRSNNPEDLTLLLSPGYYYLQVHSYTGSNQNSSYDLTVEQFLCDSYELNESSTSAKTLTLGNTIFGTIDNPTDQDWFKISLPMHSKVGLDLDGIPQGANYDVSIYNSALDYLNTNGLYLAGTSNKRLWLFLDPGDYYVLVSSSQGYSDQSQYALKIDSSIPDVFELNELSTYATPIGIYQEYSATIDNPDDQDWYQFSVPGSAEIRIKLGNIPPNGNDYELAVLRSVTGQTSLEYVQGTVTSSGNGKVFSSYLEPGQYFVRIYSNSGYSDSLPYSFIINKVIPSGSLSINEGAQYSNSENVTLNLNAPDSIDITSMCFSNDNINWSSWESYSATKAWTLPAGDGEKTVYVQLQDKDGNESASFSDEIILDKTAPSIQMTFLPSDNLNHIFVIPEVFDSTYGLPHVNIFYAWTNSDQVPQAWLPCSNDKLEVPKNGNWYLYLRAIDAVSNESKAYFGPFNNSLTYQYDANSRLVSITQAGETMLRFYYDNNGNLQEKKSIFPQKTSSLNVINTKYNDFQLSWALVDGATRYKVYLNGDYYCIATTNSLTINALQANTEYEFSVSAVKGNLEGYKVSVKVQTTP